MAVAFVGPDRAPVPAAGGARPTRTTPSRARTSSARATLATTRGDDPRPQRQGARRRAALATTSTSCPRRARHADRPGRRSSTTLGVGARTSAQRARSSASITAIRADDGPRKNQQILLKEDIAATRSPTLATHDARAARRRGRRRVPVRYYPYERGRRAPARLHGRGRRRALARLGARATSRAIASASPASSARWESYLRGTRGWEKVLVDAQGAATAPGGEGIIEEPRRGRSDPGPRSPAHARRRPAEARSSKALRGELAGGVAMIDVRTGRILGLYSKPGYDPERALRRLRQAGDPRRVPAALLRSAQARARQDGRPARTRPARRSSRSPRSPRWRRGSSIRAQISQCRGALTFGRRTFRCTHVHGATDLHKAIAESCNVYFYRPRRRVRRRHGPHRRDGPDATASAPAPASASTPRPPAACRPSAWMTLRNKGSSGSASASTRRSVRARRR